MLGSYNYINLTLEHSQFVFFCVGSFGSCVKRWKMESLEISLHEKFHSQRSPHTAAPRTFVCQLYKPNLKMVAAN